MIVISVRKDGATSTINHSSVFNKTVYFLSDTLALSKKIRTYHKTHLRQRDHLVHCWMKLLCYLFSLFFFIKRKNLEIRGMAKTICFIIGILTSYKNFSKCYKFQVAWFPDTRCKLERFSLPISVFLSTD